MTGARPFRTIGKMAEVKRTRINKYLSEVGVCSRRAADTWIKDGRVTVNGSVPEMGTKIGPEDVVRVDGRQISAPAESHAYIAFYKPVGIVCTTDTSVEPDNIIDYIGYPKRIFPVGRLDKPSEGLILLTSDGDIVNKVLRAKYGHEKEYIVTVDHPVTREFVRGMGAGCPSWIPSPALVRWSSFSATSFGSSSHRDSTDRFVGCASTSSTASCGSSGSASCTLPSTWWRGGGVTSPRQSSRRFTNRSASWTALTERDPSSPWRQSCC